MRITIDLPDDVARRLSDEAAESSTTAEEAAARILAASLKATDEGSPTPDEAAHMSLVKPRFDLIGLFPNAKGLPASDRIDEYLAKHWGAHLVRERGLDRDPG